MAGLEDGTARRRAQSALRPDQPPSPSPLAPEPPPPAVRAPACATACATALPPLAQAILSDTLNLRSPTTTEWDRKIVSMLVQYTGVEDVQLLCGQQFKAKSRTLATMSAYALCEGDIKQVRAQLGRRRLGGAAWAASERQNRPALSASTAWSSASTVQAQLVRWHDRPCRLRRG